MIPSLMLLKIFPIIFAFSNSRKQETSSDCFSFQLVTTEDICKEIRALDALKAIQSNDRSIKIIKNNSEIFSRLFQANFNNAIETRTFPE